MPKEEIIKEVFERHVFRMADKPFGLDMEAIEVAMDEYAKCIAMDYLAFINGSNVKDERLFDHYKHLRELGEQSQNNKQ